MKSNDSNIVKTFDGNHFSYTLFNAIFDVASVGEANPNLGLFMALQNATKTLGFGENVETEFDQTLYSFSSETLN